MSIDNEKTMLLRAVHCLDHRLTGSQAVIAISVMQEFARSEIARLDQEVYLDSKIEAATETWKGVDTDEFMNELRQSDDDKAHEEAKAAAREKSVLMFQLEVRVQPSESEFKLFEYGHDDGFEAGVAFAESQESASIQIDANLTQCNECGLRGTIAEAVYMDGDPRWPALCRQCGATLIVGEPAEREDKEAK